jgi:osmotically-inducible protein OsmY
MRNTQDSRSIHSLLLALIVTLAAGTTAGCAPLIVGGAIAGGAVVATDRRSVGIQLEDEAIERRINRALAERFGKDTIHINPTSYNRKVLLVGEAPSAEVSKEIEAIADRAENVRLVVNEIYVGKLSTTGNRMNDTALAAKVRAALIDAKDVPSAAIKPTLERGVAYLLGRVTEAEGAAAARAASRVDGLVRVVKVFDYLTSEELRAMQTNTTPPESPRKP